MKGHVAAEWAGFAAGLVIAGIVWAGVHLQDGWKTAALVHAPSAQAEKQEPMDRRPRNAEVGVKTDGKSGHGTVIYTIGGGSNAISQGAAGITGKAWDENVGNGIRELDHGNSRVSGASNPQGKRPAPAAKARLQAQTPELPATVSVYLTEENRIESVPLEIYVRGVVAAEMPADFHPAAMEAQALAARTYIVRRLMMQDDSGVPVPGADVTDTQTHQAYRSLEEMNRLRTENEAAWRKYNGAAARTKNRIITYNGEPIQALYFSTSNGFTENSEDVFPNRIPYLRSVASPWDKSRSPRAKETVRLPLKEFYEKLGVRAMPAIAAIKGYPGLQVREWTKGKRVRTLAVGSKTISGVEVREKLGLRSAAFTWSIKDGEIAVTTFGSGHGVGMSQWGAEGMAQAGYTAEEIIRHYYTGAEVVEISEARS